MSIKINGTDNTITKEGGSKVIVVPSLYLNNTEITASGGGGTDPDTPVIPPVSIDECGAYLKSSYVTASEIIVQVPNDAWIVFSDYDTSKNWYEINANKTYTVADLLDYDGVLVTKASEPEPMPEVDPINFVFQETDIIADSSQNFSTSFNGNVDFDNYDVDINIPLNLSYSCESADSTREEISGTIELTHYSLTAEGSVGTCSFMSTSLDNCFEFIVTISGTIKLDSASNTVTCSITATSKKHPAYESTAVPGISFQFGLQDSPGTITQTPKMLASTVLSLRQASSTTNNIDIVENLVVNNDALIQGNLSVNGYINDLSWYWDSIVINAIETNLGVGFLAKITDLTFKLNSEQISVPTLQLSPGSSYKESHYSIIWSPTGTLKIDADDITEISGSIQILRYA